MRHYRQQQRRRLKISDAQYEEALAKYRTVRTRPGERPATNKGAVWNMK